MPFCTFEAFFGKRHDSNTIIMVTCHSCRVHVSHMIILAILPESIKICKECGHPRNNLKNNNEKINAIYPLLSEKGV